MAWPLHYSLPRVTLCKAESLTGSPSLYASRRGNPHKLILQYHILSSTTEYPANRIPFLDLDFHAKILARVFYPAIAFNWPTEYQIDFTPLLTPPGVKNRRRYSSRLNIPSIQFQWLKSKLKLYFTDSSNFFLTLFSVTFSRKRR